ncbi:MAG: glycosyltransferase family 4 protein [Candidatus Woesearchaeota archaeon]|nr:MAG: glycosyltransferase family 4 protein [Candidatus Woesearchaeota archaeon]
MKLAIVGGKLFFYDGNRYTTLGGMPKIVDSFSPFFDQIVMCVPIRDGKFKNSEPLKSKNITFHRLPDYKDELEYAKYNIKRVIEINKCVRDADVVHIRLPSYEGVQGFLLAKLHKKPIFTYVSTDWQKISNITWDKGLKKLFAPLYGKINDLLIRLVVNNSVSFLLGIDLYKKYKKSGKPIYMGYTSSLSSKDTNKIKVIKRVNKKIINLLFVGRLAEEKGITYLIDAFNELNKKYKLTLTLLGQGPLEKEIKQKVEKLGLENKINILGYVSLKEMDSVYSKSDIFILPSLTDAMPKVILEAMAKSIPVIATNVGGIPTIIKHNKNGILIKPRSSDEIVKAVDTIIKDKKLRERIIKNEIDTAKSLSIERIIEKMVLQAKKDLNLN